MTEPTGGDGKTLGAPDQASAAPSGHASEAPASPDVTFPIVGIGASAGGLEAFERLFSHLSPDAGMAFVLVQHLDPTHESLLTELVQRFTRMPVRQVIDGVAVERNHVYVIPPNQDLALLQGRLHLLAPSARRGLRLPIDHFFRSLAQDQGERAIAVVLSGTGSDGTLGIRAVKGEGGMVMIQEPESAAYNGMPTSALATKLADFVLPPEEMGARLLRYTKEMFSSKAPRPHRIDESTSHLEKAFILVRSETGHDFSQYKPATLTRRIERRMVVNRSRDLEDYLALLQRDPGEVRSLFKEFLIGVTGFFRDREAFTAVERQVLPALFENRRNEPIRVWVPACSTGEEAYSIAFLLRRYMDEREGPERPVQIFATDIDPDALETARAGVYPENIATDVPEELLRRYFVRQGNSWHVKKQIREMLVFAVQNVIKDPPFSQLDLISCRNLLIYLQPELQRRALTLFNYVLRPDGWLLLGSAESLGELSDRFLEAVRKWRLYRSRGPVALPLSLRSPPVPPSLLLPSADRSVSEPVVHDLKETIRRHTENTLLDHVAPVGITVDEQLQVLYVQGRTGGFLETPTGEGTLNLLQLAREGLRPALSQTVHRGADLRRAIRRENVRIETDRGSRRVHITVRPVTEPQALRGMLTVVLEDAGPWEKAEKSRKRKRGRGPRADELEKELADTKEYLQSIVEQLETANEELTSTNEELQSSNEELQSTNEELETSQEELRSVNEELVTVNTELQSKVEELGTANNDLANLMSSTELAIVFVDLQLRVQRFTPASTRLLHLMEADLGRPLGHIATELDYNGLERDVEHLLDTLVPTEKEILTRTGRWQLMRIRPYRTMDNTIEGAVLTFVDIHEQKRGEELKKLTRAIEQSPVSVIVTDAAGRIEYVNPRFTEVTGYTMDEARGRNASFLKSGKTPAQTFRELWRTVTAGGVWHGELCNRRKNGELYWDSATISPIRDFEGRITHYVSAQEDVTERRRIELRLRESEARYRGLVETMRSGVAVYQVVGDGEDFVFLEFNQAGERIEGIQRDQVIGQRLRDAFPGAGELGLIDVLQRVWRTGRSEHLPAGPYRDERIRGWRDNYVYRLPSGEVVAVYEDVTEQVMRERELDRAARIFHALSRWHRRCGEITDEAQLCLDICQILIEEGAYRLAWVGLARDDPEHRVETVAHAGFDEGYLQALSMGSAEKDTGGDPTGRAIREGRPAVIPDVRNEPSDALWREQALERGYACCAAIPLERNGRAVGALSVYCGEPNYFNEQELGLLRELAESLAWGMGMIQGR